MADRTRTRRIGVCSFCEAKRVYVDDYGNETLCTLCAGIPDHIRDMRLVARVLFDALKQSTAARRRT